MFTKIENLIGIEKFDKLRKSNILIIGIGGVGGYTLESLVRTGIENITIIDPDKIDKTNINRQIIANIKNINKFKINEFKKRIKYINENCKITKILKFIDEKNIDFINFKQYDFVIDTCDTVETKILIIKKCLENKVKFITCMGTANKYNSDFLINDINKTSYCPLAKKIRKELRLRNIKGRVECLYSEEKVKKGCNLSSINYVVGIAGLKISEFVIKEIIKD